MPDDRDQAHTTVLLTDIIEQQRVQVSGVDWRGVSVCSVRPLLNPAPFAAD